MSEKQRKTLSESEKNLIKNQFNKSNEWFQKNMAHKKENDKYILEQKSNKKIHVRSIFSMLQNLYSIFVIDERKVSFIASNYEWEYITRMYNKLAEYDYRAMNKRDFDFVKVFHWFCFWLWATRIKSWDKDKNIPVLESIHPMSLYIDPDEFIKWEKRKFIGCKKKIKIKELKQEKWYFDIPYNYDEDKEVEIYHHYTKIDDKILFTTWLWEWPNKLIKIKEFDEKSGLIENFWFSIFTPWNIGNWQLADLIELWAEYQIMLSQITNLMLIQAKKDVLWEDRIVDTNKIDIEFLTMWTPWGRNIPAELEPGENLANVIYQIPKEQPSHRAPEGINLLEQLKQESTGISPISQWIVSDKSMTKWEAQMLQANVNMKFSLIMSFLLKSDEQFWISWQLFYKAYFNWNKNIVLDNKYKTEYYTITNKDIKVGEFIAWTVNIKSTSEIKKQKEGKLQKMLATMPNLLPYMEKENQILFMRRICELSDIPDDEIELYLPESIDEIKAKIDLERLNRWLEASPPELGENHKVFERIFRQWIPNKQNSIALAQRRQLILEENMYRQNEAPQWEAINSNMKSMQNISQAMATSQLLQNDNPQNKIISNQDIQWL